MRKYDVIEKINAIEITYDNSQFLNNLNNEMLEVFIKRELKQGYGIIRIYHFLGNWNPNYDLVIINAYGNLEAVGKPELELLRSVIIDALDEYDDSEWEE